MSDASQVTIWANKARAATTERNRAIRRASRNGMSLRMIAAAAGLTHTGIAKILERSPD